MEKILEGGYDVAKRCCVTALEASGYLVKALKEAAGPEGARSQTALGGRKGGICLRHGIGRGFSGAAPAAEGA
jgi:hypothetical protein